MEAGTPPPGTVTPSEGGAPPADTPTPEGTVTPPSSTPAAPPEPQSPEDERKQAMADAGYYCPGCGRLYSYQRECTGAPELPHPPIEVVSTDEVTKGGPEDHTPAPPSE